jgi:hypothetical protein
VIVVVQSARVDGAVRLEDPDDFRRFEVRVSGLDAEEARRALGAVAELQGDDAFVDQAGLISLPGARADDAEWMKQFQAMVEYARPKGWVDASGRLQAHLVWA